MKKKKNIIIKTPTCIVLVFSLFFVITGCKKNENSSNDGLDFSSIFSKKRILQKELVKEGGLFYYDGKPFNGIVYKMYDEKQLQSEVNYTDGKEDGLRKFWYSNGQLGEVVCRKNNKKEGKYTSWYENGQIEKEINYLEGERSGLAKGWYENGVQKFIGNYIIIKEKNLIIAETSANDGPIKDTVIDTGTFYNLSVNIGEYKEWYKNGQLALKCNYNNKGELDGLQTRWYKNGKIYEKINFKKNKETGVVQRWYDSGQTAYEKNTANDNQAKTSEAKIENKKLPANLIGDWGNDDVNGTLHISKEEVSFWGGPFSEKLTTKMVSNTIELYFHSIEGTNSFNAATNNDEQKNLKCKKIVGKCYFKNNVLILEGFGDDCGQLPKGTFNLEKR
ncbi:toxin-antitoxin system YwqK family antitoxin [Flavobacterium sp. IMCC34518]|uniref:toxin-antitoxin system YwqK family antitoxin n=1 Tax=Flavobacterium sp. IMCC34518 TaxID=3003623 RepID=UPI0024827DC0|nr:toxin-antitoxin system YwqK family antitoxin [Flavobacterium sp. IMCC34518]